MQHIDMRVSSAILHKVTDPYVEACGIIDYNPSSLAFVVSGFSDSSVWKQDAKSDVARFWSHARPGQGTIVNTTGYSTCAVWGTPDIIIQASSVGSVNVMHQQWKLPL
jgi:hypothetical protein